MDVKPIHSEKQHRAALKEIKRLWAAKAGTPGHDRLEVLAILVEDWEEKHHPIYPPDPVAAIRFRMEQLDLESEGAGAEHRLAGAGLGGALRPAAPHPRHDPPAPPAARDPG